MSADNVEEWTGASEFNSVEAFDTIMQVGEGHARDISARLTRIEEQNEQILCYMRMLCEHPLGTAPARRSHPGPPR